VTVSGHHGNGTGGIVKLDLSSPPGPFSASLPRVAGWATIGLAAALLVTSFGLLARRRRTAPEPGA
jgi:hypothetical protein